MQVWLLNVLHNSRARVSCAWGTFVWEPNVDVNKDFGMMKTSKQLFQKRPTLWIVPSYASKKIVLHTLRVDDDDTLLDFRVHVMCLRGECLWVARQLNLCNMEGETYQFGFAIVLQIHLTICTSFNLVLTLKNLNNRPTPLYQLMQIMVFLRCYNFYLAIPLLPNHRR